ncbi:MAG TPA: hypothetical protein ENN34_00735 [Deltaproteobacteria bacterium]|nr:hypothetical protein [Deltaproteobacteria bacterium]
MDERHGDTHGTLTDYSGAFCPGLTWTEFSPEKLHETLALYRRMFLAIDGFWFLGVRDRFGEDTALDVDLWAWQKYFRYEIKQLRELFSIEGNDVEALFKLMQLSAWAGNMDVEWDLKNRSHGIARVVKCHTLSVLLRERTGRETRFCRDIEQKMFDIQTACLNPEMKAQPLRLPPETLGTGICCEWELTC